MFSNGQQAGKRVIFTVIFVASLFPALLIALGVAGRLAPQPSGTTVKAYARSQAAPASPAVGFWTAQAAYPIAVQRNAAAGVGQYVYGFGGTDGTQTALANAYKYDWISNTWSAIASLPAARAGLGAVSVGQYIYLFGGYDTTGTAQTTVWRYDPSADSYAPLDTVGGTAASMFGMTYLSDTNEIYVIGGDTGPGTGYLNQVEALNLQNNFWSAKASYPISLRGVSVMATGGYVYAAGGEQVGGTGTVKTYRYDPVANSWDDTSIRDLTSARYGAFSALINGQWYLAGGITIAPTTTMVYWTVATNSIWASSGSGLVQPRAYGGSAAFPLNGGTAWYAIGGTNGSPTSDNQQYLDGVSTPTPTDTPVTTATSTPTATPAPAVLVGHVTWQGRPAQPSVGQQLPITLTLKAGTTVAEYPIQLTDPSGFFTVTVTGLPAGTYNWRAHGYSFLATSGSVVLSGAAQTQAEMGLQRSGDVNGDNIVNSVDFNQVKNNFGQGGAPPISPGTPSP